MTNSKALLRPKSAKLSLLAPAKKSTTRGPSPRRTPESEAAARLAKFGWSIISGYSSLDQPCVMKHRCGFKLSGLTPKSLCYSKKRFCAVCDRSPPYGWVNSTEELAQYIALVTQRKIALDTTVAPYSTEKLPSLMEEIPCRCDHGQFLRSVRALLRNQHCCSVPVNQLKQTYTLGRMHQQLLKPYNLFLSDYPMLDEHDTKLVRGDEPLDVHCAIHGKLPKNYTPFELQKIVTGSRKSEKRSPCYLCQPKQNEMTATTVIQFFEGENTFNTIGVRLALLSTADEIEADIAHLVTHNLRPSKEMTIKVKAISPTYGVVANELVIRWFDLLKGKQLLPISGGRHSAAHFLFFLLLTNAGLTVRNEVKLSCEEDPTRRFYVDLYVEAADVYYEMDGGPHFRPIYGKAQDNQAERFNEQLQRDALKTAMLGDKLRRITTFDVIKQKELAGKLLIDVLVAERDKLLVELGRPVTPFDPKTLSAMQDIRLIFNGWPKKIHEMSNKFYQYLRPAIDVSPDHVHVVCRHGHESVFSIYDFSKIFECASSKQTYSEFGCKGCQQVKKRAKIADEIMRASDGTLSLITDCFLKNTSDPILVNIVSGTQAGQVALFSSHGKAISQKSYTRGSYHIAAKSAICGSSSHVNLTNTIKPTSYDFLLLANTR